MLFFLSSGGWLLRLSFRRSQGERSLHFYLDSRKNSRILTPRVTQRATEDTGDGGNLYGGRDHSEKCIQEITMLRLKLWILE